MTAAGEQQLREAEGTSLSRVIRGVVGLVRRMLLEPAGWTGQGWLTSRLIGPLYLLATPVLTVDDMALGSTGLPVPMSMAHRLAAFNGWLRVAPGESAFAVAVYRYRGAAREQLATLTFDVGARRARSTVAGEAAAGLADDLYEAQVAAEDSGDDALDVVIWASPRVDVVRGIG